MVMFITRLALAALSSSVGVSSLQLERLNATVPVQDAQTLNGADAQALNVASSALENGERDGDSTTAQAAVREPGCYDKNTKLVTASLGTALVVFIGVMLAAMFSLTANESPVCCFGCKYTCGAAGVGIAILPAMMAFASVFVLGKSGQLCGQGFNRFIEMVSSLGRNNDQETEDSSSIL